MSTPFASEAQQPTEPARVTFAEGTYNQQEQQPGMKRNQSAGAFNLVASPSGKELYVEPQREYDPLAPHRPRDRSSNKGEGMGFMFSCFGCCANPVQETARTAERHYSIPASASAQSLPNKTE